MDMKKIHLFCLCLLLSIPAGLSAQVLDKVRNILGTDSLPPPQKQRLTLILLP